MRGDVPNDAGTQRVRTAGIASIDSDHLLHVNDNFHAEPQRHASVVGELLPRRRALSADAQRTVLTGGPADGTEAAVCTAQHATGGRQVVALPGGDEGVGVFGFFAQGGCLRFFHGPLQGCDFCGVLRGGFLGLLFFVFFGALFGDGLRGLFGAALADPGGVRGVCRVPCQRTRRGRRRVG
jgi:hypothetical protein